MRDGKNKGGVGSIDPETKMIRLAELSKKIQAETGVRVCPTAVYRWTVRGVKGVLLRTASVGSGVFTSMAWYREFAREIEAKRSPARAKAAQAKATAERQKDADAVLVAAGIIAAPTAAPNPSEIMC